MRWIALALALAAAPAAAQDALLTAAVRGILSGLQVPSFREDREYCGTLGIDRTGRVVATAARPGGRNGCAPRRGRGMAEILVSFHTHGAFDPNADSEVPSPGDVRADRRQGIDGYVATPGGRLWFIDGRAARAVLLCGPGCLPADPRFAPGGFGPVRPSYSLPELVARARASRR